MGEKEYRGNLTSGQGILRDAMWAANLHGTYKVVEEDPSGTHQSSQTFTITTYGREPYDVMQKVFEAQNG